jgi:hypothetical protein
MGNRTFEGGVLGNRLVSSRLFTIRHVRVTRSVKNSSARHVWNASNEDSRSSLRKKNWRTIMKTVIISALLALSVLTGVAGSASAADPERGVWGQFSTGQGS